MPQSRQARRCVRACPADGPRKQEWDAAHCFLKFTHEMHTGRRRAVREFLAAEAWESGAAADSQRVADHTASSVGRPRQSTAARRGIDRTPQHCQEGDSVREWSIRNPVCSTLPTRPHTSATRRTPKRMSRVPCSRLPADELMEISRLSGSTTVGRMQCGNVTRPNVLVMSHGNTCKPKLRRVTRGLPRWRRKHGSPEQQ
jgi:hypothetical protein